MAILKKHASLPARPTYIGPACEKEIIPGIKGKKKMNKKSSKKPCQVQNCIF